MFPRREMFPRGACSIIYVSTSRRGNIIIVSTCLPSSGRGRFPRVHDDPEMFPRVRYGSGMLSRVANRAALHQCFHGSMICDVETSRMFPRVRYGSARTHSSPVETFCEMFPRVARARDRKQECFHGTGIKRVRKMFPRVEDGRKCFHGVVIKTRGNILVQSTRGNIVDVET